MSQGSKILAELRGDKVIWMIVLFLGILSVLSVFSSTQSIAYQYGRGTEYYWMKHLALILGGFAVTYFVYQLNFSVLSKLAPYLMAITIPLLLITIFFGEDVNSAKRRIELPVINLTFQTSDLAKVALMAWVARSISSKQGYIKDLKEAFIPIIAPVLLVCTFIAPSDLSTAILLFLASITMMFIGRVSVKYIIMLFFLGIVMFSILIVLGQFFPDFVRVTTWSSRLFEFANTDGGYQVVQSKIAIAKGGFFGEGLGASTQRNYIPYAYSDFIFAIILEEYGLLGGFVVIGLYILLFLRCMRLIARSPKAFGAMLAFGCSFIIVVQALLNMAVSVHLIPVTGLTLPFVSMGGTSVLFTGIMLGLILSVSKKTEKSIEYDEPA